MLMGRCYIVGHSHQAENAVRSLQVNYYALNCVIYSTYDDWMRDVGSIRSKSLVVSSCCNERRRLRRQGTVDLPMAN